MTIFDTDDFFVDHSPFRDEPRTEAPMEPFTTWLACTETDHPLYEAYITSPDQAPPGCPRCGRTDRRAHIASGVGVDNPYAGTSEARYYEQHTIRRVEMPASEVCMHLGVTGRVMFVRAVGERMAQLYRLEDGAPVSFPITRGEAGLKPMPPLPEFIARHLARTA